MFPDFFLVGPMPASIMYGFYDWRLVALSFAVVSITSLTGLDIAIRVEHVNTTHPVTPTSRIMWLGIGALVVGIGVWSMHFIGMLAYDMHCRVSYDFLTTFLSIIPAVASAFFSLRLAIGKNTTPLKLIFASLIMGLGIGTMHFVGMAAMRMPAKILYLPDMFFLAILFAVVASYIALRFTARMVQSHGHDAIIQKLVSGFVLAVAICGLHYTAMMASIFVPVPMMPEIGSGLDSDFFSGAIFFLIFAILGGYWLQLNLSEQKVALAQEKADSANHVKGLFLANMSHELRTPMNTVVGMIDLVLGTNLDDQQRSYLTTVHRAADALLSIMDNILDFSKLEAEKMILERIPFDVRNVVEESWDLMDLPAKQKGLRLRWECEAGLPEVLLGDPHRLRQVLINLIHNAIKFTQSGFVAIIVKPGTGSIQKDSQIFPVHFTVMDTGIGIQKQDQTLIFHSFTQADGSTTRRFGGTGLGLSICRQLVEKAGGTIWVESDGISGSTFHFTIPFPLGTTAALREGKILPSQSTIGLDQEVRKISVMVVDDEENNLLLLERALKDHGFLVSQARDGQDAIDQLSQSPVDLVLMDVMMPGMDGLEATQRIRSGQVPGLDPQVPIIAVSASVMVEQKQRCLQVGMNHFISKPFRIDALLGEMRHVLQDHKPGGKSQTSQINQQGVTGDSVVHPNSLAQATIVNDSDDFPRTMQEWETILKIIQTSVVAENFHRVAQASGLVQRYASQQGYETLAHAAMKLILAARRQDLFQAEGYLDRLLEEWRAVGHKFA